MNKSFQLKYQNHLKLYVLLKDKIVFEDELNRRQILFYSEINEQPDISSGIRYFILDADREKVNRLLIENDIIASTETISNYDFRDKKKFFIWTIVIITLVIIMGFTIEFVFSN